MLARDYATVFVVDLGACARASSSSNRASASLAADDVEDDTHRVLRFTARAIRDIINSKVSSRTSSAKAHGVGLMLYGARATANAAATAARDANATASEYQGIVDAIAIAPPSVTSGVEFENAILNTESGERRGVADALEATAAATDVAIRAYDGALSSKAVAKRMQQCVKDLVLITDIEGARTVTSLNDDDFARILARGMKARNVRLRCGILDLKRAREGDENEFAMANLKEFVQEVAGDDITNESAVTSAEELFLDLQTKRTRPTARFRGTLSFGKWCGVNVCSYKLNAEAKATKMNQYSGEMGDLPGESHRALLDVAYKNVNDLDGELVPAERHVRAFRYGKQHIPIDNETEARLSMKFDKGIEVIGSISIDEVPLWLSTGEPSVLCAQTSTKTTRLGKERAEADAKALSALALALDDAKLALLVRGAWTEGSSTVHIGALTPRLTDAGDFLLYTPLPFEEDYHEYQLPPKPKKTRVLANDARLDAARAFVDACTIDVNTTAMPWEMLNPASRDMRDLCASRAANAPAPNRTIVELPINEVAAAALASTFKLASGERAGSTPGASRLRLGADADVRVHDEDERVNDSGRAREPSPSPSRAAPEPSSSVPSESPWAEVKREREEEIEAPTPAAATLNLEVFDEME